MDRPEMLERCIKSVILSTYKNIEILVSDDSDSDDSKLVVDKLKDLFQKINKTDKIDNIAAPIMVTIILSFIRPKKK